MKIDFTSYADESLEEAFLDINRAKYPENFEAVVAEIQRRKDAGTWRPVLTAPRTLSFGKDDQSAITIYSLKDPIVLIFLGFWLSFWLLSETSFVSSLISNWTNHLIGESMWPMANAIFPAFAWLLAGAVVWFWFLSIAGGKEVISIDSKCIIIYFEIFGVKVRSRRAHLREISGLRTGLLWRRKYKSFRRYPHRVLQILSRENVLSFAENIGLEEAHKVLRKIIDLGKKHGFEWAELEAFSESD